MNDAVSDRSLIQNCICQRRIMRSWSTMTWHAWMLSLAFFLRRQSVRQSHQLFLLYLDTCIIIYRRCQLGCVNSDSVQSRDSPNIAKAFERWSLLGRERPKTKFLLSAEYEYSAECQLFCKLQNNRTQISIFLQWNVQLFGFGRILG